MNLLMSSVNSTDNKLSLNKTSSSGEAALTVGESSETSAMTFQQASVLVASGLKPLQEELKLAGAALQLEEGFTETALIAKSPLALGDGEIKDQLALVESVPLEGVSLDLGVATDEALEQSMTSGVEPLQPLGVGVENTDVEEETPNLFSEGGLGESLSMDGKLEESTAEGFSSEDSFSQNAAILPQSVVESKTETQDIPVIAPQLSVNAESLDKPLDPAAAEDKLAPSKPQPMFEQTLQQRRATIEGVDEKPLNTAVSQEVNKPVHLSLDRSASNLSRSDSATNLSDASFQEVMSIQSENENKTQSLVREQPSSTSSPLTSTGRVQIPISIQVSKPEWSNMVADRTALMFAQNVSSAELQLDPPELGPLQVKVTVNQDQASVVFTAANPLVRDSVDQSIARLRELLSQQGLDLVNVDVSDQQQSSSNQQGDESQRAARTQGERELADMETEVQHLEVSYGIDSYV